MCWFQSMWKRGTVIRFLNTEWRNRNKIHERLCNVYTKATSWSNVYEWIKKFDEGRSELHSKVRLDPPSNLVNKETRRIVCCLLNNNHCLTIPILHCEIAAQYTLYSYLCNTPQFTTGIFLHFLGCFWKHSYVLVIGLRSRVCQNWNTFTCHKCGRFAVGYVNVCWMSIYWILMNELEMTKISGHL